MATVCESDNFEQDDRAELRVVENGEELFDLGALGSLTTEQIAIIGMVVRNYNVKDIAWYRSTQPEQVELAIGNIRRQTRMPLSELAPELIELGLIDAPEPEEPASEIEEEPDPVIPIFALLPEADPLPLAAEETIEATEEAEEPEAEVEAEPPVARQHIIDYVSWMYPKELPEGIDKLSDGELTAVATAVRLAAARYHKSLEPSKKQSTKRKAVKPSLSYIDLWLKGNGIPKIAGLTGKNEGSLLLSMPPFAEKIGKTISLDELLGHSDPSS